jgi:hypothetical protein
MKKRSHNHYYNPTNPKQTPKQKRKPKNKHPAHLCTQKTHNHNQSKNTEKQGESPKQLLHFANSTVVFLSTETLFNFVCTRLKKLLLVRVFTFIANDSERKNRCETIHRGLAIGLLECQKT